LAYFHMVNKMPLAFVLVNVEAGTDREVLENIKKIPEVRTAYMVYGVYDIVVMLESDTLERLREMVTKKIRQLDKVRSTMTMIVMEN
jgi:DNA-binding Lrp family transcriptional regulator